MRPTRFAPRVDALEARDVPAVTAVLNGGVLTVTGTDGPDAVVVWQSGGEVRVQDVAEAFPAGSVARVQVQGLGGDDIIDVRGGPVLTGRLDGGSGADEYRIRYSSRFTVGDFAPDDRLAVAAPWDVIKTLVDANGAVWVLMSNGDVWAGGSAGWQNKADMAFDPQGRVIFLESGSPVLTRSAQPFGNGDFAVLATNVVKWQLANGSVWALEAGGDVRVDGGAGWENKADFTFDAQGRLLLLEFPAAGGRLARSRQPYGLDGFDDLGEGVVKWQTAANGAVWVLQADGHIRVDGAAPSWENKADFAFDPAGRVILLDTLANFASLARSRQPFGVGGWDVLGAHVVKWKLAPNGTVWALEGDGDLRVEGGETRWAGTADFAFDPQQRLVILSTPQRSGVLDRSREAYGNGGFDTLAVGVVKFQLRSGDGMVFDLRTDGKLYQGGLEAYANTRDFALTGDGRRLYWLGTGDLFQRLESGAWTQLATTTRKFRLHPTSEAVYDLRADDGLYVNGGLAFAQTREFALTPDGRHMHWLRTDGLLERFVYARARLETVATSVASFAEEPGGGLALVTSRRRPEPADYLPPDPGGAGFKASGTADVIINPELHLAQDSPGRVPVQRVS